MPSYVWRCQGCGLRFRTEQSIHTPLPTRHNASDCGGRLVQQLPVPAIARESLRRAH